MKKHLKKVVFTLALSVMTLGFFAYPKTGVYAKTYKVTSKKGDFDSAATVKKGTNLVKIYTNSSGTGVIKFKAPKTKTYTFQFSNINALKKSDKKPNDVWGMIHVKNSTGRYWTVNTNYGANWTINLCSKYHDKHFNNKNNSGSDNSMMKSRYAKVSMQKGDVIYFRPEFWTDHSTGASDYRPVSFKLKIK